ncbi:hemerythrin domain-containing protein [Mannheimia pernigra]|uniref:hemerythrin domain-containing protein n=1 Tax=Mannheimia pernigra TaxID=111844 RepID=UPI001315DECF|nr:hemerythrin domain-containing protein [Mannheimia pernigra]QHB17817.1 hemerythrin domain-containing protein [Mannheimia pernigra]
MQQLEPQEFASWSEPIDMLYACHRKVKNFCKQLQILPDYLEKNGINQAVKNDVQQIVNYFNISAPLHHQDEEDDFFPELIKVQPKAQTDVDELERQHVHLHKNWDDLSAQLEDLLKGKRENVDRDLIKAFVAGYGVHIAIEEPLFELGREHLAEDKLSAIGKIMADRRKL